MYIPESKTHTLKLGSLTVGLMPHIMPGVGPRVLFTLDDAGLHYVGNTTPDDVQAFINHLKITMCATEALARRAAPPVKQARYA